MSICAYRYQLLCNNNYTNSTAFSFYSNSRTGIFAGTGRGDRRITNEVRPIQAMIMKDAVGAGASEAGAQMEAQLAEIEAQRAQLGEEMYQQMKQAMEAGAAAFHDMGDAYRDLPEPTPSEKALLERYRDQIMNLQ